MRNFTVALALAIIACLPLSAQEGGWEATAVGPGVRKEAVLLPDRTGGTGMYLEIGCG